MNDFELRFGGIGRLYSAPALERLRAAHVCVVGIGGVGSWVAEALARSGVGELTLVDLDDICASNVNRQIHALDGVIGRSKVGVMAERIHAINSECRVHEISEFFNESTAAQILSARFNYVVDAIDQLANKCLLIAKCRERGIPVIVAGGAGGRKNPSAIEVADLAQSTHDALLQQVRKKLRDDYGFPREPKKLFGVPCVFSKEPPVHPPQSADCGGAALRINCDNGYGTASFVTGTFGFVAAAHVVSEIAGKAF